MSFRPNHSANLPRDFDYCPQCGKKGLHTYKGTIIIIGERRGGLPPGRRCKYCRHSIPDCSQAEYNEQISR